MLETNRLDLSIPATQNLIIATLNEFFTVDELEQIDVSKNNCPSASNATVTCHNMELQCKFDEASFIIYCNLNTDTIPPTHHTIIELSRENKYHSTLHCNPNVNNPRYLATIIAKAINYSKYSSDKDVAYNRRSILENAATRMSLIIPSYDDIIHFRGRVAQEIYLNKYYITDIVEFTHEYNDYKIEVTSEFGGIIKFTFSNKDKSDYVYYPKTDLGMNLMLLTMDKANVKLKDMAFDDFCMSDIDKWNI